MITSIFYMKMAPAAVAILVCAYFSYKDTQKSAIAECIAESKRSMYKKQKFYQLKPEYEKCQDSIMQMIGIEFTKVGENGIPFDSIISEAVIRPNNFDRFFNVVEV